MRLEEAQHTAGAHVTRRFGLLTRLLFVLLATAMSLTQPATVLAQQPAKSDASAASDVTARGTAKFAEKIREMLARTPAVSRR